MNDATRALIDAANGRRASYGISLGDFEAMLERQGGMCAICGEPLSDDQRKVHVDHDHGCTHPADAGKCCRACVRGILCNRCNMLAGWLENHRSLLPAALAYLDAPPSARPLSDHKCPVTGCTTSIAPDGKPLCGRHWGMLSTRVRGSYWDGRATSADLVGVVTRKLEARSRREPEAIR